MKKPSVFGKYLLLERVNVGGMAEVFIAKAFGVEGFERILAIKKILPTMAEDQEFITMFIDEARISVQLNHPNIVHIHELNKYDDSFFIAMEYVAGRDLRTILERFRRRGELMPTPQAVFIASKMCEGLDYAHRKRDARGQELGIIHRDVSPQNILVAYEGEVKIIDFGIAKAANRMQKTQAGILKGKFGYMSPEQVRGMPIDRRSDIFAVGVILYEMLTGEKLFVGESDFSTLEKVRNADVPLPRQLNPDIPAGLEKVLLQALAREPEERYQWASDLQEDLMRFLLSGDIMYSGKQLAAFMKESFSEDLMREAEKMERFSAVEKPEQLETSDVSVPPTRASRRATSGNIPTGGRSARNEVAAASHEDTGAGLEEPGTEPPRMAIPGPEYSEEIEDEAQDKTQLVEADHALKAALDRIRAEEGPEASGGADLLDDGETGRSNNPMQEASSGEEQGLIDDSRTRLSASSSLDEDPTSPPPPQGAKTRSSTKPQVVIGEAQEYSGATVIGPAPSRPEESRNGREVDGGPEEPTDGLEESTGRVPRAPTLDPEAQTGPNLPGPAVARRPARAGRRGEREAQEERQESGKGPARKVSRPPSRQKLGILVGAALGVVVLVTILLFALPRKPTGVLISVTPGEATVVVGKRKVANNSLAQLPPGEYEVLASAPGYKARSQKVVVAEGNDPPVVSLELEPDGKPAPPVPDKGQAQSASTRPGPEDPQQGSRPSPPPSQVQPEPPVKPQPDKPKTFVAHFVASQPGIEVLIEGKPVGRTPDARVADLTIGHPYKYIARHAGYKPVEGEIHSEGQPEVQVTLKLEKEAPPPPPDKRPVPSPSVHPSTKVTPVVKREETPRSKSKARGRLACSSNPVGADIFVDGRPTGRQTPVPISNPLELGVGTHRVTFKFSGKSSAPQVVEIKEGEVSTLRSVVIQ